MNRFWKLNVISMLYAAIILVPIELFLNVSRFSRITGWNFKTVGITTGFFALVSVILLSTAVFNITRKWMKKRKITFFSTILWLPYLIFFIYIFASSFPITNPADRGGPGDGFIILGLLFFYPFFVLLLNVWSAFPNDADITDSTRS